MYIKNKVFLLEFCLVPALMAIIGALFFLPSWYYSLFKVVMVCDAVISFLIFLDLNQTKANLLLSKYLCSLVIISFISFLGIVSQFFVSGGFPKVLWVFLDFIYLGAKCLQFFELIK